MREIISTLFHYVIVMAILGFVILGILGWKDYLQHPENLNDDIEEIYICRIL